MGSARHAASVTDGASTRPPISASLLALALAVVAAALALASPASAARHAGPTAQERAIAQSVVYHRGKLGVRDALIRLPRGYTYLDARDAQRTLSKLYGNPPHPEVRALILPPKATVLRNSYFIVVTYENDGHVSDKDAQKIDYDAMLHSMQKDAEAQNPQLTKAGYDPVHVIGWAERPHYDTGAHKLYWAKDLHFGGDHINTLNYDVRTLGREGMLSLRAVTTMSRLGTVRSGMQTVLAASQFTGGRRYEDFRQGDKVSKLTVAAVVAGGAYAVAKTGLLALLIAKLKFVVLGIAGLISALRKRLFGRSRGMRRTAPVDV